MFRTTAYRLDCIGVLALSPAVAHAGPILDQAMRHANTLQLAVVDAQHGSTGGMSRWQRKPAEGTDASWQGMVWKWFLGGLILPVGSLPIVAQRAATPRFAAGRHGRCSELKATYARCYAASMVRTPQGMVSGSAWLVVDRLVAVRPSALASSVAVAYLRSRKSGTV